MDLFELDFMYYGHALDRISLNELKEVEGCVARTENSGSEGYYCEVVRWNDKAGKYQRFAFCKFLGGELHEIIDDLDSANIVTDTLNKCWSAHHEGIFHSLSNWKEEK